MTIFLWLLIAVLALGAGYVIGASARDAARVDVANQAHAALRRVHQENAGLTRDTRLAVIDAIKAHEYMARDIPPFKHRESLRAALHAAAERRRAL